MTQKIKNLFLLPVFWLLLPGFAPGATKVFLRGTSCAIGESSGITYWLASTQGSSKVTAVINSVAGPVSGQYWPSTTTGHIMTKTAGGQKMIWVSRPLSSGVTISGTITPNLWGLESNAACNCGARYEVLRWSVATGGIVSSLGISADDGLTEWGTSAAVRTSPTLTPTSTAFSVGDRIVIIIYNDDGSGVTEASGSTWTLDYAAGTGVDGDTYLSFTETISFSADSNNARPRPMTSRVRRLIRQLIGRTSPSADGPTDTAADLPAAGGGVGFLTCLRQAGMNREIGGNHVKR